MYKIQDVRLTLLPTDGTQYTRRRIIEQYECFTIDIYTYGMHTVPQRSIISQEIRYTNRNTSYTTCPKNNAISTRVYDATGVQTTVTNGQL